MNNIKVGDVIRELEVSKSYLYKVIEREDIPILRNESGRYIWDEKAIERLKIVLNIVTGNEADEDVLIISELGLKQAYINNRRYLGNKHSLSGFIKNTVDDNCQGVNIVADIFSGTGAVSNVFKDRMLITNDLLYSNYISNYCWFANEDYSSKEIIQIIYDYNQIRTSENNYMRQNFADTYFSADDCSKIGFIREDIEEKYLAQSINRKEYAILITSLLYAMDSIANTVGHYDAYRKGGSFDKQLVIPVLLPDKSLNRNNRCFNKDANKLIKEIECDLLYLDPPYNSRQYSDAYHLLENVARWENSEVYGIARKMNRTSLKSEYCMKNATLAFEELIRNADARYILLSYNNTSDRGNERSNAKISDSDIFEILSKKGKVKVFEEDYKSFTTGKSNIRGNVERLFLCETFKRTKRRVNISCPFNYIGGKYKLLDQMKPLFKESSVFLDVFAGGGNVGVNSSSSKVIFNDSNEKLIGLIQYINETDLDVLLTRLDEIISQYRLSNTSLFGYSYYGCDSSHGLASYNRESFLKLRHDFNHLESKGIVDYAMLYVLMVFSFNNQIRFNKKGDFNLPVGKRDFNSKMRSKLILFSNELKKKDVHFTTSDFRNIDIKLLPADTFIYCDPPYLITQATYNENGMWTNKDELDLFDFLDSADEQGHKFALSNVLKSKNRVNLLLKEWMEKRNYYCYYLNKSYSNSNYQRKKRNSITEEVLITNYQA